MPPTADVTGFSRRLRVHIVQAVLPHYRVPLFDRIGRTPGVELVVWSDPRRRGSSLEPASGTKGFAVEAAPTRSFGPFVWQPRLLDAVTDADVVVMPWHAWSLCVGPALAKGRRRGVGTLVWGHGISKRDAAPRRWLRHRLLHMADGCIVYSPGAARRLVEHGFAADKVHLALNAIDQAPVQRAVESWRSRDDDLRAFRRREGLDGRAVIIYISRLEPANRAALLLDAVDRLRRGRPEVLAIVIGDGSDRAALEERAERLGLQDHVRFTGAIYDQEHIAPWAMSARLCAYPANIGLSLLHAFGYGLPVVTSDHPTAHGPEIEALRDGVNGLRYADGDADDLAAKVERLLADAARCDAMRAAARETVSGPDGYTMERMAREYLDALRSVASTARG